LRESLRVGRRARLTGRAASQENHVTTGIGVSRLGGGFMWVAAFALVVGIVVGGWVWSSSAGGDRVEGWRGYWNRFGSGYASAEPGHGAAEGVVQPLAIEDALGRVAGLWVPAYLPGGFSLDDGVVLVGPEPGLVQVVLRGGLDRTIAIFAWARPGAWWRPAAGSRHAVTLPDGTPGELIPGLPQVSYRERGEAPIVRWGAAAAKSVLFRRAGTGFEVRVLPAAALPDDELFWVAASLVEVAVID